MKEYLFLTYLMILISGCSNGNKKELTRQQIIQHQENLIRANKYLVTNDAERIRAYAKRRNWDLHSTSTGLWYMIYVHGKGKPAQEGKMAVLTYKLWLLDGTTLCYSSDATGPKKFRIGKGGVESGLEEGVLLLKEGDKARFILPPHLAYGVPGDGIKIPKRSIIVYDVTLTNITN